MPDPVTPNRGYPIPIATESARNVTVPKLIELANRVDADMAASDYPIVEVDENGSALPRVTYLGNTTNGPFDLTITNPTIGDVFILINEDGTHAARFVFVVGDDTYSWGPDTPNGKVVLEYTPNGMKVKEKKRG